MDRSTIRACLSWFPFRRSISQMEYLTDRMEKTIPITGLFTGLTNQLWDKFVEDSHQAERQSTSRQQRDVA